MSKCILNSVLNGRFHCMLVTFALLMLCSCEKQNFNENETAESLKPLSKLATYESGGLKITYPEGWALLHDESGIVADRTVAFETPEASRITVYFHKSSPRTYTDLADNFVLQHRLVNNESVQDYQRGSVSVGGFKGVKLSWKSTDLGETQSEVTILQVRTSPFPVSVQFQFFDAEIQYLDSTILSFTQGIIFDPQGVKL